MQQALSHAPLLLNLSVVYGVACWRSGCLWVEMANNKSLMPSGTMLMAQ